jgi:RimJ/RimL family protein N-acetyltransferase
MTRLFAMIHPGNIPAIRVAERIGMTANGVIEFFNRQNALYEIRRLA